MTALENFVSPALMRALGWTLLHSLWQGVLVAGVLAGALLLLRRQRAEVRYLASAGALGMVGVMAGITFGVYFNSGGQSGVSSGVMAANATIASPLTQKSRPVHLAATVGETQLASRANERFSANDSRQALPLLATNRPAAKAAWLTAGLRYFDNHLPLFVVAWLLGLLAMSLRMVGGLLYVRRLRHSRVRPLEAVWQARLTALAGRAGVSRPVALLESALVRVPLVVGHLRPVILLPLGVVAGLSPASLEAILAHEIAHVMRRDYLVNLLQTVAEVLFFYHPAVWFVAGCVRAERENCCDDAATALCGGDSLRLARALTDLAEWSQSAVVPANPRLALAAIGSRGALLGRVRRLVQRRPAAPTLAEGLLAGTLVLGGLGLLGSSVAFARPLAEAAKPAAFDWQAGLSVNRSSTGLDTEALVSTGDGRLKVVTNDFGANRLVLAQDTALRERSSRRRPSRMRANRQIMSSRTQNPASFGRNSLGQNAGTVVITKDKKGRLTELTVNGQRVETQTDTGKRKTKIKTKGPKNELSRQFEVVQLAPQGSPEVGSYIFRGNSGPAQFERRAPGTVEFRALAPGSPQGTFIYRDGLPKTEQLNRLNSRFRMLTTGGFNQNLSGSLNGQREALRTAESALREASAVKNLSPEQRKRLNQRLQEVQAQLKKLDRTSVASIRRLSSAGADQRLTEELRVRQEELRDREQELRDRDAELQEHIREAQQGSEDLQETRPGQDQAQRQADHDRAQADRDRERAGRDHARAERDQERAERNRKQTEAIVAQLVKDGLMKDQRNYQVKLSASSMVVDGKTQPVAVLQRYLKLYESTTGRKMSATSSWVINRNSASNTNTFRDGNAAPRPPRPPRAPFAPSTPPAFQAPAPPRPPKAPSVNTKALRDELRKDGLIGQNDKRFQLQLNDAGLTVNGKRQPEALAAKYRKLVGHDGPGQVHTLSYSSDE